jgi:hypothetical protein
MQQNVYTVGIALAKKISLNLSLFVAAQNSAQ